MSNTMSKIQVLYKKLYSQVLSTVMQGAGLTPEQGQILVF